MGLMQNNRRVLISLLSGLVILCACAGTGRESVATQESVLIQLKEGISLERAKEKLGDHGVELQADPHLKNILIAKGTDSRKSLAQLIQVLRDSGLVEIAEPNYKMQLY